MMAVQGPPDALGDDTLRAMIAEVAEAGELYRPSSFWSDLNAKNMAMLDEHGLDNFKRTVAQNYFNWLVVQREDGQFREALRHWRARPTLRPFLNRMEPPGLIRTTIGLEDRVGPKELYTYKLFVGLLWEYARREDWAGLTQALTEPLLGNPIRIWRGRRLISQDLANSIREYNAALGTARDWVGQPKTVAELGAGYGRLGHVFLSDPNTRYVVFDIPPALFVSQHYLSKLFPDRKVFTFRSFSRFAEIEEEYLSSDIAFFTSNQIELIPDRAIDMFLTISTLPEMTRAQITNFLRQIDRLTRYLVYVKQWRSWHNPLDDHTTEADDLALSHDFDVVFDRTDAIQTAFFERLWRRRVMRTSR